MLMKYIFLNSGKVIIEAVLITVFVLLSAFFIGKIFSFTIDYVAVLAGVASTLVVLNVISYIKWLRSNK